jgi:hypothetical protein
MSEQVLDPRMGDWLADGPVRAPVGSFEAILAGVEGATQDRPPLRLAGGAVRVSPQRLAMAAAVVVAVTAAGGYLLRDPIQDALAPEHAPGDLLYAFPETRTILAADGGPTDAVTRTVVGRLPDGGAFVIAVACTGDGEVAVEVIDTQMQGWLDESGEPAVPEPYRRLVVPCDDRIATTTYHTLDPQLGEDGLEVQVAADAGVTWRAAVGELRDPPSEPAFPSVNPAEGDLLLAESQALLANGPPESAGGIYVDAGSARSVTILVQCLGDPITIWSDLGQPSVTGEPIERVTCDDPGRTVSVKIDTTGQFDARGVSEGFTWVRLAATVPQDGTPTRPEAPPLPAGIADVLFADRDRENVAFGSLGGNTQTVVRIDEAGSGRPGGGHVAIARPDGSGGTVLELWSIADAAPVATLATIEGADVYDSWVDPTHEQVFYGTVSGLGVGEWRRVAFDGSGNTLVASTPIAGLREAKAVLAIDDAQFVAQWCPLIGSCERAVYDAAAGEVTRTTRSDEGMCDLLGVGGAKVVVRSPACDGSPDEQRILAEDLATGATTELLQGVAYGSVFLGSAGPQVLLVRPGELESVIEVVGLDGSGRREIARLDQESGLTPSVSPLRLPAGDWVLLAGYLGDSPTQAVQTPIPILLNVVTGEQIELRNLPGGE